MRTITSLSALLSYVSLAASHGIITDPPSRQAGPAMKATCGEQVMNNQKSDSGGPVQLELNIAKGQKDFNPATCNLMLCKGYAFEDNQANVQTFSPGQTIPMKAEIKAPHTGSCNVSIVDTKSNAVVGEPLITFDDYASNSHPIPENNTQFSVTMPQNLGGKCTQAGQCVMQWFWDAPEAKQTYEACVDFTMGGGAAPAPKRRELVRRQESSVSQVTMSMTTLMTMSAVSMPPMTMPSQSTMMISMMPAPSDSKGASASIATVSSGGTAMTEILTDSTATSSGLSPTGTGGATLHAPNVGLAALVVGLGMMW